MTKNRFKKETNILNIFYLYIINWLFREKENITTLYLINLSIMVSPVRNNEQISEKLTSDDPNCGEKTKNTGDTSNFRSGLYYFNARWYDADLGRFTMEDPARDGVNWYVYCGNNPLKFVDPTGLAQVIMDDIDGNAVIDIPGTSLRERTSFYVERQDNNDNYPDILSVKIGQQIVAQYEVESSPTRDSSDLDDFELPEDFNYWAKLSGTSPYYKNSFLITNNEVFGPTPLSKGVSENMYFRIHPDTITKKNRRLTFGMTYNPPISDGCIIPKLADFNRLWSLTTGLGFSYGDSIRMRIK